MNLEKINNVYATEEKNTSSVYTMGYGDNIKFYKVPAYNDSGYTTSSLSHLWTYLNLGSEALYNQKNLPYASGGLLDTSFEDLPDAFYNTGAVAFSINSEQYRVQLNGQNIALGIPVNTTAVSALTSGITATTLYGSFIYSPDNLTKDQSSLCSGSKADSFISEPTKQWTDGIGIGYAYQMGNNPIPGSTYPYYDSGVVYLVSPLISGSTTITGATTGSSTAWSYNFGQTNKFGNGARQIYPTGNNPDYPNYYDRIVGAIYLNYGFGIIWNPELVGSFDWTRKAAGDETTTSGATFTSGNTVFVAADMDVAEILNIDIIAEPNKWVSSSNQTYIGTGEDCGIAISTITLHDQAGRLLAIAKPDEAIIKEVNEYKIINLSIPISGPIGTSLADTVGRIDCSTSFGIPCP